MHVGKSELFQQLKKKRLAKCGKRICFKSEQTRPNQECNNTQTKIFYDS